MNDKIVLAYKLENPRRLIDDTYFIIDNKLFDHVK